MSKPIRNLLFLPVFILIVGLACSISGGPTPPRQVPTVAKAAESLNETVATAKPDLKTGKITITVTESQITSYIVQNMQEDYSAILSNPVVIFQPNQVEMYGTILGDNITANGRLIFTVKIDTQGKPIINIVEANFGLVPVPGSLLENLTTSVDRSITDSMKDYQSDYRLESITINTGTATLVLVKK